MVGGRSRSCCAVNYLGSMVTSVVSLMLGSVRSSNMFNFHFITVTLIDVNSLGLVLLGLEDLFNVLLSSTRLLDLLDHFLDLLRFHDSLHMSLSSAGL